MKLPSTPHYLVMKVDSQTKQIYYFLAIALSGIAFDVEITKNLAFSAITYLAFWSIVYLGLSFIYGICGLKSWEQVMLASTNREINEKFRRKLIKQKRHFNIKWEAKIGEYSLIRESDMLEFFLKRKFFENIEICQKDCDKAIEEQTAKNKVINKRYDAEIEGAKLKGRIQTRYLIIGCLFLAAVYLLGILDQSVQRIHMILHPSSVWFSRTTICPFMHLVDYRIFA